MSKYGKSERTEIEPDIRAYVVDANLLGEEPSTLSTISEALAEFGTELDLAINQFNAQNLVL